MTGSVAAMRRDGYGLRCVAVNAAGALHVCAAPAIVPPFDHARGRWQGVPMASPRPDLMLDREALTPWIHVADPLADDAVAPLKRFRPNRLLAEVEENAGAGDVAARRFLDAAWHVPRWVDLDALERGAAVSRAFGLQHFMALMVGTLVEGYAAPSLAAPLVATGRLKQDARRRALETGHVVHNTRQPRGLLPGGVGHRSILSVRLLHAMVRRHLHKVGFVQADGGAMVHHLDMAHTASGVSFFGLDALRVLGVDLHGDDVEAVHQMWRLAHTYHGVDEALLPATFAEAGAWHAFLAAWRHDRANPYAEPLANALIDGSAMQPPFYLPRPALVALTREICGHEWCDRIGLRATFGWSALVEAVRTANRAATGLFYAGQPVVSPLVGLASETVLIHTLRDGLGDREKRAFGGVADRRLGRRLEH
jgi:hypothetical protein